MLSTKAFARSVNCVGIAIPIRAILENAQSKMAIMKGMQQAQPPPQEQQETQQGMQEQPQQEQMEQQPMQ
jgi:hypothetical protein